MTYSNQNPMSIPVVKAPGEIKERTFKKIEQMSVLFELLNFFGNAPKTLANNDLESKKN